MQKRFETLTILLVLVQKSDSQILSLCELPEENSKCTLQCVTKDFSRQPVTFSHPPSKDVGSCIPPSNCHSNYQHYSLSQRKGGNYNFTEFHIDKLNRTRDEGEWKCSYGNSPSNSMMLTVHTRPVHVNVTAKQDKKLTIKCRCYCVYPVEDVQIDIKISNKEMEIERKLSNLRSVNLTHSSCSESEQILEGTLIIEKETWSGESINIDCICKESVLVHTQIKKLTYNILGVPKKPHGLGLSSAFARSLIVKWQSGHNGGNLQTFVILYQKGNNENTLRNLTVPEKTEKKDYTVSVSGLDPDTLYTFWILAKNTKGKSEKVGPEKFETTKESYEIEVYWKILIPTICFAICTSMFTAVIYFFIRRCFKPTQSGSEKTNRKRNKGIWIIYMVAVTVLYICAVIFSCLFNHDDNGFEVGIIAVMWILLSIVSASVFNLILYKRLDIEWEICKYGQYTTGMIEEEEYMLETNPRKRRMMLSHASTMNIDHSKAVINRLTNLERNVFVKTKSFEDGLEISTNEGVLMYVGVTGDGRFTNSVHIMKHWMEKKYYPVILKDIRKWDEIVNINCKMIVLIPEIVSKVTIDMKLEEREYAYWETMMSCVQKGNTKIIMTCHSVALKDIWHVLEQFDLFDPKYQINLSEKKYKLSEEIKFSIFEKHCEKNNIKICSNDKDENYQHAHKLESTSLIQISNATAKKIAKTEPAMGFQQCCDMFCKHRKYTRCGIDFFSQPSNYLIDEIDKLIGSSADKYHILKELWINDPEAKSFGNENYQEALSSLRREYVEESSTGVYTLKHDTIYVAVGLAIAKKEPETVIKHCNWNFVRQNLISDTLETDKKVKDRIYITVTKELRPALFENFCNNIRFHSLIRYFKYIGEFWADSIKDILDEMDRRPKCREMIEKNCCEKDGIFVRACNHGNMTLMKEFLNRYQISREILECCSRQNQNHEASELLEKTLQETK